jgi:hypothetical protein
VLAGFAGQQWLFSSRANTPAEIRAACWEAIVSARQALINKTERNAEAIPQALREYPGNVFLSSEQDFVQCQQAAGLAAQDVQTATQYQFGEGGVFRCDTQECRDALAKTEMPSAPDTPTRPPAQDSGEYYRDSQRRSDVATILNAIYQYAWDNSGAFPAAFPPAPTEICSMQNDCDGLVDLHTLTDVYLTSIPLDPSVEAGSEGAGYTILKNADGTVTVAAPNAEGDNPISSSH